MNERSIAGALIVNAVIAAMLLACGSNPVHAKMTFLNQTNSSLCLYGSRDAPGTDACSGVKANAKTTWDTGCGYGDEARSNAITVVLTMGETGPVIYEKTASCKEWQDADATFVIEESGGEFTVSDNLPAEP